MAREVARMGVGRAEKNDKATRLSMIVHNHHQQNDLCYHFYRDILGILLLILSVLLLFL
jgi:hypothetical protein